MLDLTRRDVLKAAAVASVMPAFRLQDSESKRTFRGRPTLVVIYQRGGMDALNAVVPFGDKRYYEIRPTLAIPPKDGDDGPGVLALDKTFGLHPAMKPLMPYWEQKRFAPVINVGSPHTTRSHFDAQDFMEYAAPGLRTVRDGWLNRYLAATKPAEEVPIRAVAMQGLLPRALRGQVPCLAVPENRVLKNDKVLDSFEDLYGGGEMGERKDDPVVESGLDTIETLKAYKEIVEKGAQGRKTKYPGGGAAAKLRDIASLIHAGTGLEVACLDVGGWDDHANEGGNTGAMATRLADLTGAIGAFAEDLGERLDGTLVMVMTEFGRTCRENGNNGTDHGHGATMLLLGGALKGGRVLGDWRGLEDKALYESRDLPVATDFRDVFAEVMRGHMGWDPAKDFFPDYKANKIKGLF